MFYDYLFFPPIPTINQQPPTLYSILKHIAEVKNITYINVDELIKKSAPYIFDFEYNVEMNKEFFEKSILLHYIRRRIGTETLLSFKLALECRLNEILPYYNKLLLSVSDWNLFDGFFEEKTGKRKANSNSNSSSTSELLTNSTTLSKIFNDKKSSDLPQSRLENLENDSYVSFHELDSNEGNTSDSSTNTGKNAGTTDETTNDEYSETISRGVENKVELFLKYSELKPIMTQIYNDLDCLFYQICE